MTEQRIDRILRRIVSCLRKDGVEVVSFDPGKVDGEIVEETAIEVSSGEPEKWLYLAERVNECFQICRVTPKDGTVRIVFTSFNEPPEDEVLAQDLSRFYSAVKKKHYRRVPRVDRFSVLIKPTHRCNLDCKYCYERPYRETIKEDMSLETLEKIIQKLSDYARSVQLIWHGGEPTMVGIEWYEAAQKIIRKYPMTEFEQSIMSNGINYDREWAKLFKKYRIEPGMSYDVFSQSEARGRGAGSYSYREQTRLKCSERDPSKVNLEHTLKYLNRRKLRMGTITIVTDRNVKDLIPMYEHLKRIGVTTCFNTLFGTRESKRHGLGLTPEDYAEEFARYFRHWLYDENGVYERSAVEALGFVIGMNDATCANQDCRKMWLGFNPLGEIYPCDRYYPERYKCGHIDDFATIEDVFDSEPYKLYFEEVQKRFDTYCKECGYWQMCKGGCNGNPIELYGDASRVDENMCEIFRLRFKKVYDILRDVDVVSDRLNPVARERMVEKNFYSVSDIKRYMKEARVDIRMEYDRDDLLNCSEYRIFRFVNPFRDFNIPQGHTDFVYSYEPEDIERNYERRRKSFFGFVRMRNAQGDFAPEPAVC